MPRLGLAAIGVSVLSRGLDDQAHLASDAHSPMAAMGALLTALAGLIRAFAGELLGTADTSDVRDAAGEVRARRERCSQAATRRARAALDHEDAEVDDESEWLDYAALIVQVDRITSDLEPPEV